MALNINGSFKSQNRDAESSPFEKFGFEKFDFKGIYFQIFQEDLPIAIGICDCFFAYFFRLDWQPRKSMADGKSPRWLCDDSNENI